MIYYVYLFQSILNHPMYAGLRGMFFFLPKYADWSIKINAWTRRNWIIILPHKTKNNLRLLQNVWVVSGITYGEIFLMVSIYSGFTQIKHKSDIYSHTYDCWRVSRHGLHSNNNGIITSKTTFDAIMTLLLCNVSAGNLFPCQNPYPWR